MSPDSFDRSRSNLTLDQFQAAFLAGNEAFNRGDLAAAFAALPPDCEWHSVAYATERVLLGPDQVCRFFEDEIFGMFRGWRSEPVHFLQAGDGVFVILLSGRGTGSSSGAPVHLDLSEVWELRGGVPVRVREFPTWEEALSAAGLDPSSAGDLRKAERSGAVDSPRGALASRAERQRRYRCPERDCSSLGPVAFSASERSKSSRA
jgi:ketosteroid isomerase-like protein